MNDHTVTFRIELGAITKLLCAPTVVIFIDLAPNCQNVQTTVLVLTHQREFFRKTHGSIVILL